MATVIGQAPPVKLKGEVIAQIRWRRATSNDSWQSLAETCGLHPKTVYRMCTGQTRLDAPGPIEQQPLLVTTRCPKCGGKLITRPCLLCAARAAPEWDRLVVRLIAETGLLEECALARGWRKNVAARLAQYAVRRRPNRNCDLMAEMFGK